MCGELFTDFVVAWYPNIVKNKKIPDVHDITSCGRRRYYILRFITDIYIVYYILHIHVMVNTTITKLFINFKIIMVLINLFCFKIVSYMKNLICYITCYVTLCGTFYLMAINSTPPQ